MPEGSEAAYKEADVWKEFKIETIVAGIHTAEASAYTWSVADGVLTVKNLPASSAVALYQVNGQLLESAEATGEVHFTLPQRGSISPQSQRQEPKSEILNPLNFLIMKKTILSLALLLGSFLAPAAVTAQNLVPIPLKMQTAAGTPLVWLNVGQIDCPETLANEKEHLLRILADRAGIKTLNASGTATITLGLDTSLADDEAYTLSLSSDGVKIYGKTAAGVFYGLMTLEQLMIDDNASARCISTSPIDIEDTPAPMCVNSW